jgi:cysteine dioxygenase
VKVVSGSFSEELYRVDESSDKIEYLSTEILLQDEVTTVEDASILHNLANTNRGRSMTLHLYMKPIKECRIYDVATSQLKLVSLSYDTVGGKPV